MLTRPEHSRPRPTDQGQGRGQTLSRPRPSHNAKDYDKIRGIKIHVFFSSRPTLTRPRLPTVSKYGTWISKYNSLQSPCSSGWKLMVNFLVCQDFGLKFFAKAKPLRPRPWTNITDLNILDWSTESRLFAEKNCRRTITTGAQYEMG